jgi:hypothetical protein
LALRFAGVADFEIGHSWQPDFRFDALAGETRDTLRPDATISRARSRQNIEILSEKKSLAAYFSAAHEKTFKRRTGHASTCMANDTEDQFAPDSIRSPFVIFRLAAG